MSKIVSNKNKYGLKKLLTTALAATLVLGNLSTANGATEWVASAATAFTNNASRWSPTPTATAGFVSGDTMRFNAFTSIVVGPDNTFLFQADGTTPIAAGDEFIVSELIRNNRGINFHTRIPNVTVALGNTPYDPGGGNNGLKGFFFDADDAHLKLIGNNYSDFNRYGAGGRFAKLTIDSASNAEIILNTRVINGNQNTFRSDLEVKTDLVQGFNDFTRFHKIDIGTASNPAKFTVGATGGVSGNINLTFNDVIRANAGTDDASINFLHDDSTLSIFGNNAVGSRLLIRDGHNIGGNTDLNGSIIITVGSNALAVEAVESGGSFGRSEISRLKSITLQGRNTMGSSNGTPYNIYAKNINVGFTNGDLALRGEVKGGADSLLKFVDTIDLNVDSNNVNTYVDARNNHIAAGSPSNFEDFKHTFSLVTHDTVDSGIRFFGRDANGGTEAIFQMTNVDFNGGNHKITADSTVFSTPITLDANIHGEMGENTVAGTLEARGFVTFKSSIPNVGTLNNIDTLRLIGSGGINQHTLTLGEGEHKVNQAIIDNNSSIIFEDGAKLLKTDAGTGGTIDSSGATERGIINFLGNSEIEGKIGSNFRLGFILSNGAGTVTLHEDVSAFTLDSRSDGKILLKGNFTGNIVYNDFSDPITFNFTGTTGTIEFETPGSTLDGSVVFQTFYTRILGGPAATLRLADNSVVTGSVTSVSDNRGVVDLMGSVDFQGDVSSVGRRLQSMRFSGANSVDLVAGTVADGIALDFGSGGSADVYTSNIQINNADAELELQADYTSDVQFFEAGTFEIADNVTLTGDVTFMDDLESTSVATAGTPADGIIKLGQNSTIDGNVYNNSSSDLHGIIEFLFPTLGTAGVTGDIGAVVPNRIEAVRYSGVGVSEVNGSINAGAVQVGNAGTIVEVSAPITANAEFLEDGKLVLKTGNVITGNVINVTGTNSIGTIEFESDPATQVTGLVGDHDADASLPHTQLLKEAIFSGPGDFTIKPSPNGAQYAVNQGTTDKDIDVLHMFVNVPPLAPGVPTNIMLVGPGIIGGLGGEIEILQGPAEVCIGENVTVEDDIVATLPNDINVGIDGTMNGDIMGVNSITIPKTPGQVATIGSNNFEANDIYFAGKGAIISSDLNIDANVHVGSDSSGATTGSTIDLGSGSVNVVGTNSTGGPNIFEFSGVNCIGTTLGGTSPNNTGGMFVAGSDVELQYNNGAELLIQANDSNIGQPSVGDEFVVIVNNGNLTSDSVVPTQMSLKPGSNFLWEVQYDDGNVKLVLMDNTPDNINGDIGNDEITEESVFVNQQMLFADRNSLEGVSFAHSISAGDEVNNILGVSAGCCYCDEDLYGAWVSPFFGTTNQTQYKNDPGYKVNMFGAHIGFDAKVNDSLIAGGALTFIQNDIKHKDAKQGDKTKITSYMLSLYGLYHITDSWFADCAATYGNHTVENRDTRSTVTGVIENAKGDYKADSITVGAMLGYKYQMNKAVFIPSVGFNYNYVGGVKYVETGAIINRTIKTEASNRLDAIVSAKVVSRALELSDNFRLFPEIHASVRHDLIDKSTRQNINANSFNEPIELNGRRVIKTEFKIGADLNAEHGAMEYGVGYDFKVAKKRIGHEASLTFRVNF